MPVAHGLNAAPSSEHSVTAPAWSAENSNVAEVSRVEGSGPDEIVVAGGPTTVQVALSGVGSTRPAPSIALTSSVCCPGATPPTEWGDEQSSNGPPSREHSKSRSAGAVPLSVPLKVKTAGSVLGIGLVGPETEEVAGASTSVTVHS
jgi:hypothetical protein